MEDRLEILAFYSPYTGAGKTTAAKYLTTRNHPFYFVSFASPLRDAVMDLVTFPYVRRRCSFGTPAKKEKIIEGLGVSFRDMMVTFGMAGRELHPDLWIRMMDRYITSYPSHYVIDDLRFPNEYEFLRRRGAKIVRLINPGREIVPTETEALLEGYDFDAELVNAKKSRKTYAEQLDTLGRDLFPEMAQWFGSKISPKDKEEAL